MNPIDKTSWSPYAVGAGIGALSCFTFVTAGKPLGVSTPFESTAAALAQKVAPGVSGVNGYLAAAEQPPKLDWEWMLAAGIVLGSFLSAGASGDHREPKVPLLWSRRFGRRPATRYAGAFAGGALAMFGARMARGCTSGHAISGSLQLAGSSFLFSPIMAVCGALVARALFGKGRA